MSTQNTSNDLNDYFPGGKTFQLRHKYNVTTVTEAQKLTDEQILKCRNIGRKFLSKLRNIQVSGIIESQFTKTTSRSIEKAGEKEPLFVLRGKDLSSPKLVLLWMAENEGNISDDKLRDAFNCVMEMRAFPGRKRAD